MVNVEVNREQNAYSSELLKDLVAVVNNAIARLNKPNNNPDAKNSTPATHIGNLSQRRLLIAAAQVDEFNWEQIVRSSQTFKTFSSTCYLDMNRVERAWHHKNKSNVGTTLACEVGISRR